MPFHQLSLGAVNQLALFQLLTDIRHRLTLTPHHGMLGPGLLDPALYRLFIGQSMGNQGNTGIQ